MVGMEMYLLRVVNNRSDAKRGMKAESLLRRDGVKKINPDGPGLMLVGREMLQRGRRTSRFGIGVFLHESHRSSVRNQLLTPFLLWGYKSERCFHIGWR